MYTDNNGLQAMTTAGILEAKSESEMAQINWISRQFMGKKASKKGKGKGKNNNSNTDTDTSTNLKPDKSATNSNKKKKCAWCNDTSHPTWKCETFGNGKWDTKQCTKCKGFGHPIEACVNPSKKEKKEVTKK